MVGNAHPTSAPSPRSAICWAAIALLTTFAGCAKPGATKTLPPPVFPQVLSDTPESATRSALLLMQNELRAVAARDDEQTQRIHLALLGIVARRDAEKALKNVSGAKSLLGDDVVSGMVELWTAALAHYSEGIDFNTLSVPQAPGTNHVSVYVSAKAGSDTAHLRVDCVREDNRWFIGNFAIEAAGPPRAVPVAQTALPTSSPSSVTPASAPATLPLKP